MNDSTNICKGILYIGQTTEQCCFKWVQYLNLKVHVDNFLIEKQHYPAWFGLVFVTVVDDVIQNKRPFFLETVPCEVLLLCHPTLGAV